MAKERAVAADAGSVPAGRVKAPSKDKKRKRDAQVEATVDGGEQVAAVDEAVAASEVVNNAEDPASEPEVEVEAVSHKEQRKRRKLEKKLAQSSPSGPTSTAAPAPAATKTAATETIFTTSKRSPYGVWVGNLHFSTSPQDLVHFFTPTPTSSTAHITRLHMPAGKRPGEANKGFAYVDFDTKEGQEEAVKMSEGHLEGRRLLIKSSTDFSGRPAAATAVDNTAGEEGPQSSGAGTSKTARRILAGQKQPPGPCLFLGNLGFATTEESIKDMFDAHHRAADAWKPKTAPAKGIKGKAVSRPDAPDAASDGENNGETATEEKEDEPPQSQPSAGIRRVRLGTFEDSGKCKGWAFVDFLSTPFATAALTNPRNHHLDGRSLKVEYASPDAVRRGGHSEGFAAAKSAGQGKGKGRPGKKEREEKAGWEGRGRKPRSEPETTVSAPASADPIALAEEAATSAERPLRRQGAKEAFKGRQKPGAALANAKRGKTGIVKGGEGMGKKVVFA